MDKNRKELRILTRSNYFIKLKRYYRGLMLTNLITLIIGIGLAKLFIVDYVNFAIIIVSISILFYMIISVVFALILRCPYCNKLFHVTGFSYIWILNRKCLHCKRQVKYTMKEHR